MATWGDQTCQKFEATAVGFETELDMACFVTVERSVIRRKQGVICSLSKQAFPIARSFGLPPCLNGLSFSCTLQHILSTHSVKSQ